PVLSAALNTKAATIGLNFATRGRMRHRSDSCGRMLASPDATKRPRRGDFSTGEGEHSFPADREGGSRFQIGMAQKARLVDPAGLLELERFLESSRELLGNRATKTGAR